MHPVEEVENYMLPLIFQCCQHQTILTIKPSYFFKVKFLMLPSNISFQGTEKIDVCLSKTK